MVLTRLTTAARHSLVYRGSSIRQTPVRAKCSCTTGVFEPKIRPHHATAPRSALAAVPGAHHVSPGCARLSVPAWSIAVVYLCRANFIELPNPALVNGCGLQRMQRCSFRRSVTERSQLLLHEHGTICAQC